MSQGRPKPRFFFEKKLLTDQKYYYERARGIFVTAATAGIRALRVAKIQFVIVEKASQIRKLKFLNKTVYNLLNARFRRVSLLGDQMQLPPTYIAMLISKFGLATIILLMECLLNANNS